MKKLKIYKFKQGEGWKYVNNRYVKFKSGGFQIGDTSEQCILYLLDLWLRKKKLPSMLELLKTAYPNEEWKQAYDSNFVRKHTEIPRKISIKKLLEDLTDVNFHSLRDLIEELIEKFVTNKNRNYSKQ